MIHTLQDVIDSLERIVAKPDQTRVPIEFPMYLKALKQHQAEILRPFAPDERIVELAQRLVAAGPKACAVSASETHEISEFILGLIPNDGDGAVDPGAQSSPFTRLNAPSALRTIAQHIDAWDNWDVAAKLRGIASALDKPSPWVVAADTELVVANIDIASESDTYEQAIAKLNRLIHYHIDVATNPQVNGGYKLVKIEPDATMLAAGEDAGDWGYHESSLTQRRNSDGSLLDIWMAMIGETR